MAYKKGVGRKAPKGMAIRGVGGKRPRVIRSSGWQWTAEAEEIFFNHLAASANVTASAEAAGFCTATVYRLRKTRADFAHLWEQALAQGYARLEAAMLRAAADTMEGIEFPADSAIPPMSVDQAMNVLRAHRNEVRAASETGRGPGQRARPRPIEEVRASIIAKVEALRRAGLLTAPTPEDQKQAAVTE